MGPLGLKCPPPHCLPQVPPGPDIQQHPEASGACQQLPQEVFIGPQGPDSASMQGPPSNPSEGGSLLCSVLGEVCFSRK